VGTGTIQVLQYLLLTVGLAGSLYTAWRITGRRYQLAAVRTATLTPSASLIVVLAALNVYPFMLPMAHRM
jgi:hypothetical protein